MSILISVLITFLIIIFVLYLVNMLPIDGRAKQIVRQSMTAKKTLGFESPADRLQAVLH